MQSIQIKYLPATDKKGARLKATCEGGFITEAKDYSIESNQQALNLAFKLANQKLNWGVKKFSQGHFKGCDYFNDFSFIIPKNPENLFKSLINSILAFLKKQDDYGKKLGFIESTYKDDFFKAFKIKNSNYFNNYLVYATTYGLGYYCLLLSQNQFNNINKQLETFLKENNINNYKNEFSAACWVYRFKFKSLKENNINLLKNLILQF